MKIIYHHRTEGDGAEGIHIREMIGALQAIGEDVRLVSITDRGESRGSGSNGRNPIVLKNRIPSALYEVGEVGYNAAGIATLLFECAKNRTDFIYERYSLYNLSAGVVGKLLNIPVFLEVNAPLAMERSTQPDEKLVFRKIGHWFEQQAFHLASGIVVVSSPLRDYIVSLGIAPGKILVLPNGVDETKFQPRIKNAELMKKYRIPQGKMVIGFSGIFRHWHGIDVLLEAFQLICSKGFPVHLLLVGDGPMREWIMEKVVQEGLENACTITGRIPYADMPEVVSLMDIAVSPRATFYASPMKIMEYMALKKAVVAPDTANIRDIVTEGQDGILFLGNSPEAMATAIISLLTEDSIYERTCQKARETVETRLNWRANARRIIEWVRSKDWERH